MYSRVKLISILMCMTLVFVMLQGCHENSDLTDQTTDGTEDNQSEERTETQKINIKLENLQINGVDISEYRIVYATSFSREQCYEDYSELAKNFALKIETMTGYRLPVFDDSEKATQYEIILGSASRVECIRYYSAGTMLNSDDYCVMYSEGKILLGADCLAGVADACDIFTDYIAEQALAQNGVVNIGNTFNISGEQHVTRIVCVGDSITEGLRSTDETKKSYPTQLQAELGYEYDVINYGSSGKTMCSESVETYKNQSYIKTSGYYDDLLSHAEKTDIVIIMLGTNDAAGVYANTNLLMNNFDTFKTDYKNNLSKMVNDLRAENEDIKIVLFNTPICFRETWEANYNKYLRPFQKSLAEELGIDFYDINSYTAANMTTDNFPDGLHPNDEGYQMLAKGASKALKETYADMFQLK